MPRTIREAVDEALHVIVYFFDDRRDTGPESIIGSWWIEVSHVVVCSRPRLSTDQLQICDCYIFESWENMGGSTQMGLNEH